MNEKIMSVLKSNGFRCTADTASSLEHRIEIYLFSSSMVIRCWNPETQSEDEKRLPLDENSHYTIIGYLRSNGYDIVGPDGV